MSQIPGINAYDKPVENDFEYVYTENKNKGFRKVTKAMMKVLLGVATKLSELENDKGFVDNTVNDLKNYYLKTDTYSKDELDNKLSLVPRFSVQVVTSLPTENISDTTVYLVPAGEDEDNLYTEYINVDGLWEILGTQKSAFSGSAKDVTYDDAETNLGATNVQDAIGKLSEAKVNGVGIKDIIALTQEEYDALEEKVETTLYIIKNVAQVEPEPEPEPEPDISKVPYLHITAPCDIDTGIAPTVDIAVEVTFYDTDMKNNNGYIGAWMYQIAGQNAPWLGAKLGATNFSVNVNNFSNTGVKNTFRLDKTGFYINGTLAQSPTNTPTYFETHNTTLHLFLSWNNGVYENLAPNCWLDDAKFYSAKIWEAGELVRDIIPAKDSSGVVCVYDKVTKTYLYTTDTNTGVLTYGEEVAE